MSLLKEIESLIKAPVGEESIVIIDVNDKEFTIEEALKKGIAGTPTKKLPVNNKDAVAKLIWEKERVGVADLNSLKDMVNEVIVYLANNSSAVAKSKIKKEFPELFPKAKKD